MKVSEIMTRRVITIPPDARVERAVELMLSHRIGGLPVCAEDGSLAGILTDSDLLRRHETGTERRRPRWLEFVLGPGKLADEYAHSHGRVVEEIMTRKVRTIAPQDSVADAVSLMERKRIHRLPVVEHGQLVGIVTRADLMRALLAVAPELAPGAAADEQIRAGIWAEIERQPWTTPGMVSVLVRNGVVTLSGAVPDPRQIDALRVLAENVPGVRAVQDDLAWVDYLSGAVVDMTEPRPGPAPTRPPTAH